MQPSVCDHQALFTATYASNLATWLRMSQCEWQAWTSNALYDNSNALGCIQRYLYYMDPCMYSACCEGTNACTNPDTNPNTNPATPPLLGEIRASIELSNGRAVDPALYNKIVLADHDISWEGLTFPPIPDAYFVDRAGEVFQVSDGTALTKALSTAYHASNEIVRVSDKVAWTSNALVKDHYWQISADKTYTYTDSNVAIRSGCLGIGTTAPRTQLEVQGNARVINETGSNGTVFIGIGDSDMNTVYPWLPRNGIGYKFRVISLCGILGLEFFTLDANEPAMVVSASGTVGIKTGKTPSGNCSLHVKHRINATDSGVLVTNTVSQNMAAPFFHEGMLKCLAAPNTTFNALSVVVAAASTSNQTAYIRTDGRAYLSQSMLIGGQGENQSGTLNSFQLTLTSDSAVKPSSAQWTVSSDARLKEDIELADIDLCLANVRSIPLKYYKWRDDVYSDKEVRDRRKLGWIAQDVKSVFPKAVTETHMCGYDDCMTLNTDQIYASMYGAVQKLVQITDGQSQLIAELLKRVGALESSARNKKMTR